MKFRDKKTRLAVERMARALKAAEASEQFAIPRKLSAEACAQAAQRNKLKTISGVRRMIELGWRLSQ